MPKVLTANRLLPGEVVYWNGARGWVERLGEAELLMNGAGEAALEEAQARVARREVVNPYLFEVRTENGTAVPVKAREAIRASGPTVRRDLGKQAG